MKKDIAFKAGLGALAACVAVIIAGSAACILSPAQPQVSVEGQIQRHLGHGYSFSSEDEAVFDEALRFTKNEAQAESIAVSVSNASKETGVSPLLLASVIEYESGFNTTAATGDAVGLMQMSAKDASSLGLDASNQNDNVLAGAKVLAKYGGKKDTHKDLYAALIGFHEGESVYEALLKGGTPSKEADAYAENVLSSFADMQETASRFESERQANASSSGEDVGKTGMHQQKDSVTHG